VRNSCVCVCLFSVPHGFVLRMEIVDYGHRASWLFNSSNTTNGATNGVNNDSSSNGSSEGVTASIGKFTNGILTSLHTSMQGTNNNNNLSKGGGSNKKGGDTDNSSSGIQGSRRARRELRERHPGIMEEVGILGFTFPITIEWYFSPTGAEYCHTYFWICKDLAWTQEWRNLSLSFGIAAIFWSLIILYHSVKFRNWHEIINATALLLWLFANFIWMTGEIYDITYPDNPSLSDTRTLQSARLLEVAVVLLLIYYFILVPFDLLPITAEQLAEYDDGALKPRFSYFRNFRQYENVHMIFWLTKDLAWNLNNPTLWFLCLVPTMLLAIDFLHISYTNEVSFRKQSP
jgi:hypothetical protein